MGDAGWILDKYNYLQYRSGTDFLTMSDVKTTAYNLYHKHGLQQATFVAFHNMQKATEGTDSDYWLHVLNHITVMDVLGETDVDYTQQKNA